MASPLDNHLDEVLAGREAGKSFAVIARDLEQRHGLTVGKRGLSAWYRRRQKQMRERRMELEDFGRTDAVPPVRDLQGAARELAVPEDDWAIPSRPRRIELKVVRSSQES